MNANPQPFVARFDAANVTRYENSVAVTRYTCPDCDGLGAWLEAVRYAGEAYGCQSEAICESCNGLGTIDCEPICPFCDNAIGNDACCHRCEQFFPECM